jgi:hypothetical protein
MAGLDTKYWYPKIDGQPLKVRYHETTTIEYNESVLHDRLGDRYLSVLAPDLKKIRANLDKLESLFTPVLSLVGSPSPDKVRVAIETGIVNKESFAGAFKKTVKRFVHVGKSWAEGPESATSGKGASKHPLLS